MQKIFKTILVSLILIILFSCSNNKKTETAMYEIIPKPLEISLENSKSFILDKNTKIIFPKGSIVMKQNAEFLADYLKTLTGFGLQTSDNGEQKGNVILELGLENSKPESYLIDIDENTIKIKGSDEAGVFYGIQTLRKSTPIGNFAKIEYPSVSIEDSPRLPYRGMHLDVARHFMPIEFVKKYIDLLALHNINTLHWHLTDDQGWRIEIKKYPKLTEIGSKRSETVIGRNTGEFDGIPHEGFYTQPQIAEIVEYAKLRHVNIIPEVDIPGHTLSVLAAYPELGCVGKGYEVEKTWGVFDDVLCAGNEDTYKFLEDVFDEIINLFPYKYIHIGGDECPKVRWEACPKCQAKIKEEGIKGDEKHDKEHYLQSYFTARMEKYLNSKGRSIIGWDEILEGELAPNATVMSWRGIEGGIEAAKMGHDVIMTPTTYCYFDYYQSQDTDKEPLAIGGYVPVELVYSFNPVPDELPEEAKKHIIGLQANIWSEYLKKPESVEYMVFPRIAALAESQWTLNENKNYNDFQSRLPRLLKIYDKYNVNYSKSIFDIIAKYTPDTASNTLIVDLKTISPSDIYYTLGGTEPNSNSEKYINPFNINKNTTIRVTTIYKDINHKANLNEEVFVSKSSFKPIKLVTNPDKKYSYTGGNMLNDGLLGKSTNYKNGKWLGFQSEDLIAIIDMQKQEEISSLSFNSCVNTGDWIFDVSEVIIEVSDDNVNYKPIFNTKNTEVPTEHFSAIKNHSYSIAPTLGRYFKITLRTSTIPEWHNGKGTKAFIFIDELILN